MFLLVRPTLANSCCLYTGLEETIKAAYNLDALLKSDLGGGLDEMKAVAQQLELFLKLRGTFAKRFRVFINEKFEALVRSWFTLTVILKH